MQKRTKVQIVLVLAFFFLLFDLYMVFYGSQILDLGYIILFGWMFIAGSLTIWLKREEIQRILKYGL